MYAYKNDSSISRIKIKGIYEDFKTWFEMIKLVQNQLKFFFRNLAKEEIKFAKKEISKIEKDMRLIFTPYEKNNQREFIFNNFTDLKNFRRGRYQKLEDMEDYLSAKKILQEIKEGKEELVTFEEVFKDK